MIKQIMNIYLERIEEYNDDNNAILYLNENALEEESGSSDISTSSLISMGESD